MLFEGQPKSLRTSPESHHSIVSGRSESAPGLKTAKGGDDKTGVSLVDMQVLSHQLPAAEMNRRHIFAVLTRKGTGAGGPDAAERAERPCPSSHGSI